ncbi:hypothetical protein [Sphingomonas hankookensis]|uniref:hypothetical protein n=1 Tax=Sphingomonas hankookensis TaxID=563996 RepID=UPI003D302AAA
MRSNPKAPSHAQHPRFLRNRPRVRRSRRGGWWYDSGTFVRAIALHFDDAAAIAAQQRANRLLERLQRHRPTIDSCLYAGGRYRALTFTGLPPERFPAERPRYA